MTVERCIGLFATVATNSIIAANVNADADDDFSFTLLHMPLLIMLTPMQKCRMLLAILLVHCCAANNTVAAVA